MYPKQKKMLLWLPDRAAFTFSKKQVIYYKPSLKQNTYQGSQQFARGMKFSTQISLILN
jgi:hypothetical protein